ncbi:hypothetical protein ElyMa_002719200 [Elysia marginata]|uniref:Uncharacterized protein n=1 Tax=Elysia marginata TaxID=1093978 RepID=A0AAV4HF46_9GAST|nr:hypothetical protein ElyMa_002719200 [Elysia marginata]
MEGYLTNCAPKNKLPRQIRVWSPALKCTSRTWGTKVDPTCSRCQEKETTEQVLNSCKECYTLALNIVLQELALVISTAKGQIKPDPAGFTIFTA